jgi:hypothetical protein
MFRKALLTIAAAVAMFALSSVARADTITLVGVNGTGVTATITNYSRSGDTFTFTINNTSIPSSGATGTITNIGFDLPGDRLNNFTLVSSTNSHYGILHDMSASAGAQNFTLPGDNFDFVLHDKFFENGNKTFGGGKVGNGIVGGGSATFVISGNFGTLSADEIARHIFARFQEVNGGGSDVAVNNTPASNVPEPMTMLLFGTGLAGIAARARRRGSKA